MHLFMCLEGKSDKLMKNICGDIFNLDLFHEQHVQDC